MASRDRHSAYALAPCFRGVAQDRSSGSDIVSRINESSTGTPVSRGANVAIFKVQFRQIDGRLIFSDSALKVINLGTIYVFCLLRNDVLHLFVALEISLI